MVKEQYLEVEENIQKACIRAGRKRDEITLIAVSKTKPLDMLLEAYDAGARDFGENKVQEILEKFPAMPADARFHMIGHLQRNKVRQVIDKATLIHSEVLLFAWPARLKRKAPEWGVLPQSFWKLM